MWDFKRWCLSEHRRVWPQLIQGFVRSSVMAVVSAKGLSCRTCPPPRHTWAVQVNSCASCSVQCLRQNTSFCCCWKGQRRWFELCLWEATKAVMDSSAPHSLGRGIYLKAQVGPEGTSASEKASSEKKSAFSFRGRIWATLEQFCLILWFWGFFESVIIVINTTKCEFSLSLLWWRTRNEKVAIALSLYLPPTFAVITICIFFWLSHQFEVMSGNE